MIKFIWVVRYHDSEIGMDIERDTRVDHTCALYERDSSQDENDRDTRVKVIVSLFAMNGNKVVGVADVIKQRLEGTFDTGVPVPKQFQTLIKEYYNFQ